MKKNIVAKTTLIEGGNLYTEMRNIIHERNPYHQNNKQFKITAKNDVINWLNSTNEYMYKMKKIDKTVLYTYTTPIFETINNHKAGIDVVTDLIWKPIIDYTDFVYDFILDDNAKKYFKGNYEHLINIKKECKKQTNEADYNYLYAKFINQVKEMPDSFLNDKFKKKSIQLKIEASPGIMFYYQYVSLYGKITFEKYCSKIPKITKLQWINILNKYIEQLDDIFKSIPKYNKQLTVYRGSAIVDKKQQYYISTTLSKDIAKSFGNVYKLDVDRNSCIIPLFNISRYSAELELLLYTTTKYTEHHVNT